MICYNVLPTLKLWDEILSVDCPPTLTQEWLTLKRAVLEGRVTNVSCKCLTAGDLILCVLSVLVAR